MFLGSGSMGDDDLLPHVRALFTKFLFYFLVAIDNLEHQIFKADHILFKSSFFETLPAAFETLRIIFEALPSLTFFTFLRLTLSPWD